MPRADESRGSATNNDKISPAPGRPRRKAARLTLVAIAGLVAAASLPPVQLRLVRALAAKVDGADIEIGRFRATPNGLALGGLRVETAGFAIEIAEADADLAFWASLSRFRLEIEELRLGGIDIRIEPSGNAGAEGSAGDLDAARPAGDQTAAGSPFVGLAPVAKLPARVAVRAAAADGTLRYLAPSGNAIEGRFTLAASDFTPGQTARAQLSGDAEARRLDETLAAAAFELDATVSIDADAAFESLMVAATLETADGARGLAIGAAAELDAAGERYGLTVDGGAGARLVEIDATLTSDGGIAADWQVAIDPGVLAAFARGRSTADLSGTATGTLRFEPNGRRAEIVAAVDAAGSGWGAFDPRLVELGELGLALDANLALEPGRVDVRAGAIALSSAGRGELLRIDALQPLAFETDSWLVDPATWGEPALSARINGLPLRWLGPLGPARRLTGGELDLALEVIRDEERVTRLVMSEPLRARRVSLAPIAGVEAVFDLTLEPRATLANGELVAEIEQLTISADTGLTVDFTGRGGTSRADWPIAEFEGNLTASVPALERIMPALDRVRAETSLSFDFENLTLSVATASAGAETDDGREFVAVDLSGQQPLRIPLPVFLPDWDAFEPQTATLRLDRMPIDWLSPYIPELELRGGELSGRLTATATPGSGVELVADSPLVVEELTPVYRGRAARQAWRASLNPTLSLGNASSALLIEDLVIRSQGGDELGGEIIIEATAGSDRIRVATALDGRFPSLVTRTGAQLGTMRFREESRIDPGTHRLDIERLELELTDARDNVLLRLENLAPFFIETDPFGVGTSAGNTDILRVAVTPLELEDFLPRLLGFELEGVLPEGEFFGRAEPDGGLVLAADRPLVFRDVSVRWEDALLLDRVTMSARYEIVYSIDGVEARSVELTATAPDGTPMLEVGSTVVAPLTGERTLASAAIDLTVNLPALVGQPILDDLPEFRSGRFEGAIGLVNAEASELRLSASLSDAVTERLGRLPDVRLGLEAVGVRGESVAVAIPLELESEAFGVSALRFDGSLTRRPDGPDEFSAALTGGQIASADLRQLARLFETANESAEPAAPSGAQTQARARRSALEKLRTDRHAVPVWTDDLAGSATVAIDRVRFPSLALDGIRGRLALAPNHAVLESVEASMLGASLRAGGSLAFDAASPTPYALEFSARIDDLELGALFRAVDPNAEPTAEGVFSFTSDLSGTGRNPIDLLLSTFGEIRLAGRNGVFRGLAPIAGTGATASRVVGVLTFSRELRALARLIEGLGEIRFNQADVALSRATPGTLDLESLSLRSPQISIEASGRIALTPEQPLVLSPLELDAALAARGDIAVLFDGMELLEAAENNVDYRSLIRPISITGSPAEPDASQFWDLLDEGAENARGSFGIGLRALNRRLEQGEDGSDDD